MGILQPNFNEVPDEIPPVTAGVRTFLVHDAPKLEEDRNDSNHTQLNMQLVIHDENVPGEKGRLFFDNPRVTDPRGAVRARRFVKSIGATIRPDGSVDWVSCKGLVGKCIIKHSVSKKNGKTYANVDDFVIPGDPEYAPK